VLYVCAVALYVRVEGLDVQIRQKFHYFIVFHVSIWGALELYLGELSPPKPPPRYDGAVTIALLLKTAQKNFQGSERASRYIK